MNKNCKTSNRSTTFYTGDPDLEIHVENLMIESHPMKGEGHVKGENHLKNNPQRKENPKKGGGDKAVINNLSDQIVNRIIISIQTQAKPPGKHAGGDRIPNPETTNNPTTDHRLKIEIITTPKIKEGPNPWTDQVAKIDNRTEAGQTAQTETESRPGHLMTG